MGVTRHAEDVFFYGYIDDEFDVLAVEDDDEENNIHVNENKRKNNKKRSRSGTSRQMYGDVDSTNSQKMSSRQQRNYDRLKQLMNLIEKEDMVDLDYDLFEPSISAFAELFMETEKMKIWNDFINTSEDEQHDFLEQADNRNHRSDAKRERQQRDLCDNQSLLNDGWEVIPDNRKVHPAFSAAECFKRIGKDLRTVLNKKNLPKDLLAQLEDELTAFFTEWPTTVYVSQLLSSFERLLMHALCQYLDLTSRKLAHDEGSSDSERFHTQVFNKHPYFCPPPTRLTDYLSNLHL